MVESAMLWPLTADYSNGWGLCVRSKIVLAAGLALMASACDKKAEGQTVAIVNGEEITVREGEVLHTRFVKLGGEFYPDWVLGLKEDTPGVRERGGGEG